MDFVYKNPYTRLCARNQHTVRMQKVPNIHEHRSFKNPQRARHLIQRTIEGLRTGSSSFFFPAGAQKFTAREEINGKSAVERILKQYPEAKIMLVRITGMWVQPLFKSGPPQRTLRLARRQWDHHFVEYHQNDHLKLFFFILSAPSRLSLCQQGLLFLERGLAKRLISI